MPQIKSQSAGAYFTAIVDKKKYTIVPTPEERLLIKKEIQLYNTKESASRLKKILTLLRPKEEKAKTQALIVKKKAHKEKKEAIKELKEANKELATISVDSTISPEDEKLFDKKIFLIKNSNVYLKPFVNVRFPKTLVNRFIDFIKAGTDLSPLINFWKLALLNPNEIARTKLFDYLAMQNITITPKGYIVTYRMVKKTTKSTPDGKPIYTSAHSGREDYVMGTAFSIPRKDCDEDGKRDCSRGLHTGTHRFIGIVADKKSLSDLEGKEGVGDGYGKGTKITTKMETPDSYGTGYDRPAAREVKSEVKFDNTFGNQAVICLVNPMHVVSVPDSNTRKMRSCELFFCGTTTAEEVIDLVEKDYHIFDHAYYKYELEEIEKMLKESKLKEHIDNKLLAKTYKKKEDAQLKLDSALSKMSVRQDEINIKDLNPTDIYNIIKDRVKKIK
jgi:hypothetical protein